MCLWEKVLYTTAKRYPIGAPSGDEAGNTRRNSLKIKMIICLSSATAGSNWVPDCSHVQKGDPVKNLLLLAVLALVVTPRSVYAAVDCAQSDDQQGNNKGCKPGIGATAKFGIWVCGAVRIRVACFLLLPSRRPP